VSAYPQIEPTRVVMDLDLRGWAVFAGRGKACGKGMLLEGQPGVCDHVWLWSTGDEVHGQPHYTFSTWDEFWADAGARMHATGFGGLFPFTLGEQRSLREGFLSILDRAASLLDVKDAPKATAFRDCAARIRAVAAGGVSEGSK
jgi:hypothetical protein